MIRWQPQASRLPLQSIVDSILHSPRELPEPTRFALDYVVMVRKRVDGERSLQETWADPDARARATAHRAWYAGIVAFLIADGVELLAALEPMPDEAVRFESLAARIAAALDALEAAEIPWWPDYCEIADRPYSVVQFARLRLAQIETRQIRRAPSM